MKELQAFSLEELCEKYKLKEEDNKKISNQINKIMLYGKRPVQDPVAIMDIAPPGSGKTGLNGMAEKEFEGGNVVLINSDELKPFHPSINFIAKYYPEYYTKITNKDSNIWTDNLFDEAVNGNYNIIFEGTGRNLKLLEKMFQKMSNYKIIVRAMAVSDLNCLMSIVERYEGQIHNKGWGRLVTLEHFYKAYEEMLNNIEEIEKSELVNTVEVYMRTEVPTEPKKIYSNQNKEYTNAKYAVIDGRKKDESIAKKYYQLIFEKDFFNSKELLLEKEILKRIDDLYKVIGENYER